MFSNPLLFLKDPANKAKEKTHPSKKQRLGFWVQGTIDIRVQPETNSRVARRSNFRQATYVRLKKKTVDLEPDDPEVDKNLG